MIGRPLSRRDALRLLGLAGAASLTPRAARRARAQSAPVIPTRILFFYTNHGSHRSAWLPKGVGGAAATETAFELNEIMLPLETFKDRLLIVDGLDMLSSDEQSGPAKNAHIRGHCHSLVAADMASADLAGDISIDQHIARSLNQPVPVTSIPSLEIGIDPNVESLISFAGPAQKLPIESDPRRAFERLFPSGAAPGARSPADGSPDPQRSVLDFALAEFAAVLPKLDREDRLRAAAHADALRDLESRLQLPVARACSAPQLPAAGSRNDDYASWYTTTADNFMRLIQAAFSCDLTRVVTFNLEAIPDALCGYAPNLLGTTDLHDLIHKVAMRNDALSTDPAAVGVVTAFHTEYAKLLARLLGYLDAVREADGQSLLDHTIVLWCGEIAEGNHDLHRLPWLIAGRGGGAVRTGRYLQVPRSPSPRGHNDLFVALANAMGSDIATFGNPEVCRGPLALT